MIKRLLGAVTILAAIGAAGSASAAEKIAIGMSSGINQVPSLVAQAKGYFKEEGLEVDLKPLARGAVAIEGVSGGSLQFAESAHAPFLASTAKGVPLIAVGVAARGFLGKLVAAPKHANLKKLADFKGMRIGTQVGTGMYTVIQMLMEREGLKPSDFQITNLRVVDMPAAMAAPNNNFDAVIGWEPGMARIVNSGHGKVILNTKDIEDLAHVTYPFVLSTNKNYYKDHKDVVQKVLNAYAKADKFAREHHDETIKIYIEEVKRHGGKLTDEEVKLMLYDTERYGGPAISDRDMEDIVASRAFLIKTGKLKSPPELDQIIDQSFAKKAQALAN
jgi:aliphatic sulfonates family ABC transporter substrate-binding protein